ncbi:ABC transporter substrate-binding protein [Halomonas sp. McH1-25]|uniref:ABC transporter substrate-binding protein n=1 Tax=unclassified Halomonas TaxID=2609666 RepID=UPI001EF3EC83|nr:MULTISPECIES: ABC transporter substrate-binding protein [unclassified Halomonas]MCG7598348.1 ABC transporter substrate-binding protein [Halomonas sp. McH1-25]MCP1342710.1 ABC transporter substrate-binding protein [Halomonas sp. FL8]MCP1362181.1 ABC transporter substrate-binding protein [Halomonas sp. BBD45]MCP1364222.1 ABC transporter substrate-binding protein [Halomonas sp. BBD48]
MKHGVKRALPVALAFILGMSGMIPAVGIGANQTLDEAALQAAETVVGLQPSNGKASDGDTDAMPISSPQVITGEPEPIVPPPARPLRVALDWYLTPYHAALVVARERDLFKQAGLDVTLIQPADPTVPPKLVAAQHVELALTSQPRLHLLEDQGLPLIRVGTLVPAPLATLLVRQDASLDSLAQIKGKKVGYVFKMPAQLLLDGLLDKHALTARDVDLQRIDFGLNTTLADGDVDAVIGALRHVTSRQLEEAGVRVIEFPLTETDLPIYDELIVVANRDVLQQHRRDIRYFLDALEQATLWLINHPEAAWELVRTAEPSLDTEANAKAWPDAIRYLALRPAAVQMQRYQRLETYLLQQGLIEHRTPANRLATDVTRP